MKTVKFSKDKNQKIIGRVMKEADKIVKTVGRDLGEMLETTTSKLNKSDIEDLVRAVLAERIDPFVLSKADRKEEAQAVIAKMHRSDARNIQQMVDAGTSDKKSDDDEDDMLKYYDQGTHEQTAFGSIKKTITNRRGARSIQKIYGDDGDVRDEAVRVETVKSPTPFRRIEDGAADFADELNKTLKAPKRYPVR